MAAAQLKLAGLLYPCFESEAELRAKREQALRRHAAPIYDRAMLSMTPQQLAAAEANGKDPYWRFKLSGRTIEWRDLVLGMRAVKLTSVSDPVLIRADGSFLYTFTSVVDDLESQISHIIRGEDHITNSGVQVDLLEALGGSADAIRFAHLPLLTEADGGKFVQAAGCAVAAQPGAGWHRADGADQLSGAAGHLGRSGADEPGRVGGEFRVLAVFGLVGAVRYQPAAGSESAGAAWGGIRRCCGTAAGGGDGDVLARGSGQPGFARRGARGGGMW